MIKGVQKKPDFNLGPRIQTQSVTGRRNYQTNTKRIDLQQSPLHQNELVKKGWRWIAIDRTSENARNPPRNWYTPPRVSAEERTQIAQKVQPPPNELVMEDLGRDEMYRWSEISGDIAGKDHRTTRIADSKAETRRLGFSNTWGTRLKNAPKNHSSTRRIG